MLYIKTNISDDVEMKVDLYDDEIYTQCSKCGKEMQVETEVLRQILQDGDLASTSLYCGKCSKEEV
ncbi:MAG: hypothetical protein HFJ30_10285 [Clostridia bacterium]|jgi:uncharacterized Zn finger protein|nr:hypothetical protein [Clostridia bacterium]